RRWPRVAQYRRLDSRAARMERSGEPVAPPRSDTLDRVALAPGHWARGRPADWWGHRGDGMAQGNAGMAADGDEGGGSPFRRDLRGGACRTGSQALAPQLWGTGDS